MNMSQISSSLSCYGKTYLGSRRGKIKVQPTAFSRKNFKNGSRQKQDTSRKRKLELSNRRVALKIKSNFAKIVKLNQQQHIVPERKAICRLLRQKQIRRLTNNEIECCQTQFLLTWNKSLFRICNIKWFCQNW